VALFDRVLEKEPDFARAIGARAYARAWLNFLAPSAAGYAAVVADAKRALSLDPGLAEPRVALASISWSSLGKWDVVTAVRELKAVTARAPNVELARVDLTRIYSHLGWFAEARQELAAVRRIHPASIETVRSEAVLRWFEGDPRGALEHFRRLNPEYVRDAMTGRWQMLQIRLLFEDPRPALEEAEAWLREKLSDRSLPLALAAVARVRSGRKDIADLEREIFASDPSIGHFHHSWHLLAEARAQKNDAAGAVDFLRLAAENGFPCTPCFENDPLLAPIRSSPDYVALKSELASRDQAYRSALKDLL